jgi:hypothetical protein
LVPRSNFFHLLDCMFLWHVTNVCWHVPAPKYWVCYEHLIPALP